MKRSLGHLLAGTVIASLWSATAVAQPADAPVRLRSRTFVPPANVSSGLASGARAAVAGTPATAGAVEHVLLQFPHSIDGGVLARLRGAGAIPLRYVPENAISAAVPAGFDPAAVGARWIGRMQPADKISLETTRDLARLFPGHPLSIVEFHPDLTPAAIEQLLADVGTGRLDIPLLPPYAAVIPTDAVAIARLAQSDAAAWIYPAPADLDARPIAVCQGIVRPEGLVANYAAAGDGWDGAGRGTARLQFFVSRLSADLSPAVQMAELIRAMGEWSRYAAISWTPGSRPDDVSTVDMLWGPAEHGDGFPFEPGVLAHAFYPVPTVLEPRAGDIHFNDEGVWGAGEPNRWDVFSVALHELGHSLGLAHSADPVAVMYPVYGGNIQGLAPDDIAAIRQLYAHAFAQSLPGGWTTAVIGDDATGGVQETDGRFEVSAGGRDIWGTADQFRFVSRVLEGDGDIVARVDSLSGTHRWTKAGVMLRASEAEGSVHAMALVSRGKGLAFQRRLEADGLSVHTAGPASAAPVWLWLSRRGDRVAAYAALDGAEWLMIGADTIALGPQAVAGLAVTSHETGALATAVFSQVSVTAVQSGSWRGTDVGDVGRPGTWSIAGTRMRVRGAGPDIWGTADAFHFVWKAVTGDVDVVARLESVTYTRSWAKAGVMIRSSLDPGAAHAFMLGSALKGFAFQRRPVADGWSAHTSAGLAPPRGWLRLSRRGTEVAAYLSTEGRTWTLVGTEQIALAETAYVGLAVSSHTAAATTEAVFDYAAVIVPR